MEILIVMIKVNDHYSFQQEQSELLNKRHNFFYCYCLLPVKRKSILFDSMTIPLVEDKDLSVFCIFVHLRLKSNGILSRSFLEKYFTHQQHNLDVQILFIK